MKINFTDDFLDLLIEIVEFIALDKPIAAKNFKKDLISSLKKDLQNPYHFKKSIHFNHESYRDYVFKGYSISYQIFETEIAVLGIIKNKFSY